MRGSAAVTVAGLVIVAAIGCAFWLMEPLQERPADRVTVIGSVSPPRDTPALSPSSAPVQVQVGSTSEGEGAARSSILLDGVVRDTEAEALARVTLVLTPDDGGTSVSTTTGVSGAFSLRVAAGSYRVQGTLPACRHLAEVEPTDVELTGRELTQDFTWTAGQAAVRGLVVDCHGNGVAGVRVHGRDGSQAVEDVTDASGAFELAYVRSRSIAVEVDVASLPEPWHPPWWQDAPGHGILGTGHLGRATIGPADGTAVLVVPLSLESRTTLRVGYSDGAVCADATLSVRRQQGAHGESGGPNYVVQTDALGEAVIENMATGTYSAEIYSVPEGTSRPDPVDFAVDCPDSEELIDIVYGRPSGCRILVRVMTLAGAPIAERSFGLWPDTGGGHADYGRQARASARTRVDGTLEIDGIPTGRYVLLPDPEPPRDRRVVPVDLVPALPLSVGEDDTIGPIEWLVDMAEPTRVEGVVIPPESTGLTTSRALLGVRVHLEVQRAASTWRTVLDPDREGRFVVDPAPSGDGVFTVRMSMSPPEAMPLLERRVVLPAGGAPEVRLELPGS